MRSDEIINVFSSLRCFVSRPRLCNVAVGVFLTFHTFQIFFFDENINAFLDYLDLGLEATGQLVEDFGDQLRVIESLTHLHDSDNCSLDQHLAVLFDVLVSRLLFSFLFGLDREIDVDAEFFAGK